MVAADRGTGGRSWPTAHDDAPGTAAVGGFLFGFDSSVINGAVDAIAGEFDLGPTLTGFAVRVIDLIW